jgi:putative spermidine/putrescine transport system substrate-binding protein
MPSLMVKSAACLGALVLLAAAGFTVAVAGTEKRTLRIASWGGAYAESQQKAYVEPYRKIAPDVAIELVNSGGEQVDLLRAQTREDALEFDLVDVTAADAIRLCRDGIALPVNHQQLLTPAPDGTPPLEDFGQTIVSECFIPEIVYSTTFGYRVDKLPTAPTRLCDVFDLKRFPGKRALEARPINNLEWALICDGVAADQVYQVLDTPEGLARAFAKLDTIRAEVVWWTDGGEPVELLAKGTVVMASAYNGRLFDLIARRKNSRVAMLWDYQAFDFDGWIIPKKSRRLNDALNFVRFATDTQRLADQARYISYGPARRSSTALVGQHAEIGIDMLPHLPTSPENAKQTLIYNYDWWAAHRDEVDAQFKAWRNGS